MKARIAWFLGAAALAACLVSSSADAGGLRIGIGVGVPFYSPPCYYNPYYYGPYYPYPYQAYAAPAPVYYPRATRLRLPCIFHRPNPPRDMRTGGAAAVLLSGAGWIGHCGNACPARSTDVRAWPGDRACSSKFICPGECRAPSVSLAYGRQNVRVGNV